MDTRYFQVELRTAHHHTLFLNRKGRWGTTDNFTTSFLHFFLFSTALWDLANSRPVHFSMLSSHLFLCRSRLLPPFTVPCKMVLARPDERETCSYHFSLRLLTMVRRSSTGPIAGWILAKISSLVTMVCQRQRIKKPSVVSDSLWDPMYKTLPSVVARLLHTAASLRPGRQADKLIDSW